MKAYRKPKSQQDLAVRLARYNRVKEERLDKNPLLKRLRRFF